MSLFKKLSKITTITFLVITLFAFNSNISLAKDNNTSSNHGSTNGFSKGLEALNSDIYDTGVVKDGSFADLIFKIINFLLGLIAVLALGAIIWGGILYIISLGDDRKISQAKTVILYAIIGVLVVGVSFLVISTLKTILS